MVKGIFFLLSGFIIGSFILPKIVFSIIYSLPKSVISVIKKELSFEIIFIHLKDLIFLIVVIGFIFLTRVPLLYSLINNEDFIIGLGISTMPVVSSLLFKNEKSETFKILDKDYINLIKKYKKV